MNNYIQQLTNFFFSFSEELMSKNIISEINQNQISIDYLSKNKKGDIASNFYLIINKKITDKNYDFKNDLNGIQFNKNIELKNILNSNKFLTMDPTIPTITNDNIKCVNPKCPSITDKKPNNICYIKYDEENIHFMYICKNCDQKWTNDI